MYLRFLNSDDFSALIRVVQHEVFGFESTLLGSSLSAGLLEVLPCLLLILSSSLDELDLRKTEVLRLLCLAVLLGC